MIASNFDEQADEGPASNSRHAGRASRRHPLGGGLLVGLAIAILITLVVVMVRGRGSVPRLTQATYDAAVERWEARGPADYDLDLVLRGKRPGKIHVKVRGGEVVHMTRDGVEPSQKRTWDVWSVPGQLETIDQEMEMARDPAGSFGIPGASEVVMWAEFDPRYGYPRRYDRVVLGADIEVHWEVVKFQPLSRAD